MWVLRFGVITPWGKDGLTTMTGLSVHWTCCERIATVQIFGVGVVVVSKRVGACPCMGETLDKFSKFLEDRIK